MTGNFHIQGRSKEMLRTLGGTRVLAIIGRNSSLGSFSFSSWRSQIPKEKLNEFPKRTQLVSGGRRMRSQAPRPAQRALSNELAWPVGDTEWHFRLDTQQVASLPPHWRGGGGGGGRARGGGRQGGPVTFCLCTWVAVNELTHIESRLLVWVSTKPDIWMKMEIFSQIPRYLQIRVFI